MLSWVRSLGLCPSCMTASLASSGSQSRADRIRRIRFKARCTFKSCTLSVPYVTSPAECDRAHFLIRMLLLIIFFLHAGWQHCPGGLHDSASGSSEEAKDSAVPQPA